MSRREQAIAAWAQSNWDEVAAFIGPNAGAFHATYDKAREKAASNGNILVLAWSWPAFLFSFAWFAYRKQWVIAAVLVVTPVVVGYFLDIGASFVGAVVAISIMAKCAYLQDAVTKIARIKAAGGGREQIVAAGGVSMAGAIVGGMLLTLATASAIYAIATGGQP